MKKIILFCLLATCMVDAQNGQEKIQAAHIQPIVSAWQDFLNTSNWQKIIKGCAPLYGPCGIVYELPNFLNRPNEGLAIVDMRQLDFAEPHYHPDLEIYFVLQGEALVVVGYETYKVKKGDVVVIAPFKAHYTIPDDNFVIACVNIPPYTPESYIPLNESNHAVDFDYLLFKKDTELASK
jgi:mannose-6-phosphate isomerase-like protein (cupin superfamily)